MSGPTARVGPRSAAGRSEPTVQSRPSLLARPLLLLLAVYRRGVSPLLGPHCRFAPSCSAYAVQALTVHGAGRGTLLAVRRLLRCHPFHPGGHDPVPPVRPSRGAGRARTSDHDCRPTTTASGDRLDNADPLAHAVMSRTGTSRPTSTPRRTSPATPEHTGVQSC